MMDDTSHLMIVEQMKKSLEYAKEEYNKDFHACLKGLKKKRGYCLANFDHFFPQGYKELWRRRLWNIYCEEEEIKHQKQVKAIYEEIKLKEESVMKLNEPATDFKELNKDKVSAAEKVTVNIRESYNDLLQLQSEEELDLEKQSENQSKDSEEEY